MESGFQELSAFIHLAPWCRALESGGLHGRIRTYFRDRMTAKAQLPTVPFSKNMRKDVYDLDENRWALWDSQLGYMTGWMTLDQYKKFWKVQYGVIGRSLPGRSTEYRGTVDEWEKNRNGKRKEQTRPEGHSELPADVGTPGDAGRRMLRAWASRIKGEKMSG